MYVCFCGAVTDVEIIEASKRCRTFDEMCAATGACMVCEKCAHDVSDLYRKHRREKMKISNFIAGLQILEKYVDHEHGEADYVMETADDDLFVFGLAFAVSEQDATALKKLGWELRDPHMWTAFV